MTKPMANALAVAMSVGLAAREDGRRESIGKENPRRGYMRCEFTEQAFDYERGV